MDSILIGAYKQTFDRDPADGGSDWEIADALMMNFNVPKLGEDLAKQVIFRVVNHIDYPDKATTERIVGKADVRQSFGETIPVPLRIALRRRFIKQGQHPLFGGPVIPRRLSRSRAVAQTRKAMLTETLPPF